MMMGLGSEIGGILCRAPGKAILFGEHAVVFGGAQRALAVSLGLWTLVGAFADDLGTGEPAALTLSLPDLPLSGSQTWSWSLPDLVALLDSLSPVADETSVCSSRLSALSTFLSPSLKKGPASDALHAFLYLWTLLVKRQMLNKRLTLVVRSQLPIGAGLGSSASFSAAMVSALLLFYNHLSDTKDPSSKELINQYAFLSEKIIHGNPSGIDNSMVVFGGAGLYSKGNPLEPVPGFKALSFLLIDTRVSKSTRDQVEKVAQRRNLLPGIMDPILDAVRGIVDKSIRLFSNEKEFGSSFYRELGTLVSMNHSLLGAMGVSHAVLEKAVQIASSHGLSCKLTGAGGGGCALALIPPDFSTESIKAVVQDLQKAGLDAFQANVGCPGVESQVLSRHSDAEEVLKLKEKFFVS